MQKREVGNITVSIFGINLMVMAFYILRLYAIILEHVWVGCIILMDVLSIVYSTGAIMAF